MIGRLVAVVLVVAACAVVKGTRAPAAVAISAEGSDDGARLR